MSGSQYPYKRVLYLLGFYHNAYEQKQRASVIGDIELAIGNGNMLATTTVPISKTNKYYKLAYKSGLYCYSLLVFMLFIYSSVSFIYSYAHDHDNRNLLLESIFNVSYLLTYLNGYIYYDHMGNKFFKTIIKRHETLAYRYNIWMMLGVGIGLVFSLVTVLTLYISNYDIDYYKYVYYGVRPWLILTFTFFVKFINYINVFACIITFSANMWYHNNELATYTEKINEFYASYDSRNLITITDEYQTLKQNYEDTIESNNTYFSITSVMGLIAISIMINRKMYPSELNYLNIINFIIFMVVEMVYIMSLNIVRKNINRIISHLSDRRYSYIMAQHIGDIVISSKMQTRELMIHNIQINTATKQQLDWIIMTSVTNQTNWKTFEFLGFEISDITIIKKFVVIIVTAVMAANTFSIIT